nr:28S ribosomal protein S22, mitochondrial-like isoform X2 [Cherax quadricarinatus]
MSSPAATHLNNVCKDKNRDPAPVFFSENVQTILKKITGTDFNKVFRQRFDEKKLSPPEYKFMTDEELKQKMKNAERLSSKILQMPPVLKERQAISNILSRDPAITGFENCKFVFTDITYGLPDRKRLVVVRDPDGTLRQASWEEAERMNQIYNPRPGRKLKPPKLFQEEHLTNVLERGEYEFVLDSACAQFEPDDPEYLRITSVVYESVDKKRCYQLLHSTRHYGPLCFYLTWNKKIENLLISLVQQEKLEACADIVRLYQLIHTDCKSKMINVDPNQHLELLKAYVEHDSLQQQQLQLAIQAYQEIVRERQQYNENVKTAHGL